MKASDKCRNIKSFVLVCDGEVGSYVGESEIEEDQEFFRKIN